MSQTLSLRKVVVESVITGILAWLVFLPITGLVLQGYSVEPYLERPFWMALAVALGRFLFLAFVPQLSRLSLPKVGVSSMSVFSSKPLLAGLFVIGMALPFVSSKYWMGVAVLALIYVLLGLGLNIVVGLAGLLDLGFVAFYAVGAYGYALGNQNFGLGFWAAIPLCAMLAGCFGMVLAFPVLRMHGDYLAIVTLGFGEIIRLVLNNWVDFTGGPSGVFAPAPTLFGLEFARGAQQGGTPFHEFFGIEYSSSYKYIFIYVSLFLICCAITYVLHRLKNMPMGRAWEALREDEIACRSLGLNHVKIKLSAFAMGAMTGGIAGVFFAGFQGFINPTSFTFFESALILAIVVLGGMGSIPGVIISALVLTLLPEVLREFANFRVLVFGILMVVMMIWRPRGLLHSHRPTYQVNEGGAA